MTEVVIKISIPKKFKSKLYRDLLESPGSVQDFWLYACRNMLSHVNLGPTAGTTTNFPQP